MKKRIAALVLLPFVAWILWPLPSSDLRIVDDAERMAGKQAYLSRAPARPSEPPPNVVLIVADDLGKTDISLYGGKGVATPRIDSIAHEGVRFDQGYVTSPVCSPSRAALMTGRYQQRFGFEILIHDRYPRNRLEWAAFKWFVARGDFQLADRPQAPAHEDILRQGLPPSELTLAEILKHAGYATGVMGKWHLGFGEDALPLRRGFDYHYGFYDGYSFYADPKAPDIVNHKHDDFTERFIWDNGREGNRALRRNGELIEDDAYLTTRIAEESVAFIEQHKDAPFFLYVPFLAPHTPFQVTRAFYDRFASEPDENKRVYYAMIAALDDAVGQILDALERSGVAGNTMVYFLSDNGGATYTKATENAPLRGGKFTNFEGGINVPFMLRFPGRVEAGTRFAAPVSSLDVFATTLAATGVALPTDRTLDGVDLLPFVRGEETRAPHRELFWREVYAHAVRKDGYKLVVDERAGKLVLFDLEADPLEAHDLADERPEVAEALQADFAAWDAQMQRPAWPSIGNYVHHDRDGEWFFPL